MQNSYSRKRLITQPSSNNLSLSHSQKLFYINDELTSSKDVATIFHSPYKDGRKNENYINPTFLSSSLFYADEQVKRQLTPKHNLIYNKNQRSKRELYNKRIQKEDFITNTIHQAAAHDISTRKRSMKCNEESMPSQRDRREYMKRSVSRSGLREQNNERMKKQLETLIKYRENDEKKQQEISRRIYTNFDYENIENFEDLTPIYAEKNRAERQQKMQAENKRNLKQWMQLTDKIRKIKNQENKKIGQTQHKIMDKFVLSNNQRNYLKQMQSKKNAGMLANILREQIKQAQAKKLKEKKQRSGFY